jgi:hypothetical protein
MDAHFLGLSWAFPWRSAVYVVDVGIGTARVGINGMVTQLMLLLLLSACTLVLHLVVKNHPPHPRVPLGPGLGAF